MRWLYVNGCFPICYVLHAQNSRKNKRFVCRTVFREFWGLLNANIRQVYNWHLNTMELCRKELGLNNEELSRAIDEDEDTFKKFMKEVNDVNDV